MTADQAEPYQTFRFTDRVAAIVPLDDLTDLGERLAVAGHLADKAAGTVTGITDDELDAYLDRLDAGEAR